MEELVFGRRYRALEKIGSGGMADVYKAVDEVLGRTVAVKVMHPRYASDPSFATRFRQEAQAAANLQSPNIVNMYDWGADGDTYYMVMEYVRGTDLKTIIQQKGYLSSAKVADIGAQICAALSVAHGYDIIHRDIKPHNIMVQPDGSVKVMDFGIARAGNTTMTQTGSVLGTAHYVSPEQAQGKELQATSDLYSLGIVLYEASTGHVPFDADTPVAVALKQVNEQPKPPRSVNPNVDPALEAIITKAMQKNPAQRYASADEMRRDLTAVAQGRMPTGVEVAGVAAAAGASAGSVAAGAADHTAVLPTVGRSTAATQTRRGPAPKKRPVWPWLLVVLAIVLAGFGVAWALKVGPFAPSMIEVPDLTGMSQAQATLQLTAKGLSAGTPTQEYSDTIPASKIISQDPKAGASVTKGTVVTFVLSKGPTPVVVPNIVGMSDTQAIATLQAQSFVPYQSSSKYSSKPVGQVLSQDPAAHAQALKGSQVTYVTSKGPQLGTVPDVRGESKADAIAAIEKAGFKYSIGDPEYSDSVDKGLVISQDPSGGGQYATKTTVTIVISLGQKPVTVPDLSGMAREAAIAKLQSLGLQANVTASGVLQPDSTTFSGTVLDQSPAKGKQVSPGSTVDITVDEATEPPAQ